MKKKLILITSFVFLSCFSLLSFGQSVTANGKLHLTNKTDKTEVINVEGKPTSNESTTTIKVENGSDTSSNCSVSYKNAHAYYKCTIDPNEIATVNTKASVSGISDGYKGRITFYIGNESKKIAQFSAQAEPNGSKDSHDCNSAVNFTETEDKDQLALAASKTGSGGTHCSYDLSLSDN